MTHLHWSTLHCTAPACGSTFDLHTPLMACPKCGELLEVAIDAPQADAATLKQLWSERRRSFAAVDASGVWRFREALPQYAAEHVVTLREGNVPLVRAQRAAEFAGVTRLHFKHLGWNPTGC